MERKERVEKMDLAAQAAPSSKRNQRGKILPWRWESALAMMLVLGWMGAGCSMTKRDERPTAPVALKRPKTTTIHGYTETDDYAWMADKTKQDPQVLAYLKAENEYADQMMRGTEDFQKKLYQEMLGRIKETDENVPYRQGGYFYYTRTEEGKQYPIFCRRKGSLDAPEEVTLDLNRMAEGKAFFSLGLYQVSDDGNRLAFATDETGFRQYKLFLKDLASGEVTEALAERITSLAWATDNRTVFYTQEDETTKRSNRAFRHVLGTDQHDLLFEEKDELFNIGVGRTRSKQYVMLTSASYTTSEVRWVAATAPNTPFQLVAPRREGHEYYLDHLGDAFYIRTNDQGKNFRLVTAPLSDPSPGRWKERIPHRPQVMLEDVECFATHFLTLEREDGLTRMEVYDLGTGGSHRIEFPEPVYVASPGTNQEFTTTTYRFGYESLITPKSVFDYDVKTRTRTLKKQQPVLGGYQPEQYISERLYATAEDGVKIPISIVYRKDRPRDGRQPLLLDGYGSYGISNDVDFNSGRLSLLDRGLAYAIAHIRGGGELGKDWHDQGKLMKKMNTFTDFIRSAEHLIAEGYTAKEQLAITGGSAGGLLMGAVTNLRPDLFRVVLSYVPFVDVMNTMLDTTLPLTVGEYLEWGNPNEKPAYDYMRRYSPYDNLERKAYPTMLIRTSLNDSQVMYWEPAKYVARLRVHKTDDHPLLFKTKLEPGGHGGASGRYDRLRDTAFDYAFLLRELGVGQ